MHWSNAKKSVCTDLLCSMYSISSFISFIYLNTDIYTCKCPHAVCVALKWPAFWLLCSPGIRLKALCSHRSQSRPVQAQSLTEIYCQLALRAKHIAVSCCSAQEPEKSGQWQGMKLAETNFKQNPSARETWVLPKDDSSHKALFLLITLDFIWLWVFPKSCWGLNGSWGLISSRKYGNRQLLCTKIWSNLYYKVRIARTRLSHLSVWSCCWSVC